MKLLYNLLYMCVSHSNGIIVVQSGGWTTREIKAPQEEMVAHGTEKVQDGESWH